MSYERSDFTRYKSQLAEAQARGEVRQNITLEHGKKASKKTCKDLLTDYCENQCRLSPQQFRSILDHMCRKKDGTVSEYTQKLLAPLYKELDAKRLPHYGLVLMVLEKLNKPFIPKLKKDDEEEENNLDQPKTVVKKTAFVKPSKPNPMSKAELKKKLEQLWREKTSEAWRGDDRTDHIKSVGNGL